MTNTAHYNLNIAEGSDKYNHLTIDNPNYQIIDAQMYDNEIHAVSDAAELKSGSVHAITRTNGDSTIFKFVATSDFVAGETFVLDGEQVSAYTTDGQPLTTNAYRIGNVVLVSVNGSVLTFYVQAKATIAEDSEKLGGELPEYYGTAANVTRATQTAQAAATVANQANQAAVNVTNAFNSFKTYSVTEQVVGTWYNGKPIYRTCFSGTFENNQLLLSNVDCLVGQGGSALLGVPRILPFYLYSSNRQFFIRAELTAANTVTFYTFSGDIAAPVTNVQMWIEYTKTTD